MKFEKSSYWAVIFMVLAVFGFAPLGHTDTTSDKTSKEEVKKETQDLIKALKAYTADQRDEATQKIKSTLANLDERIDALEKRIDNKWDQMDKAAREKARTAMKALRKQRNQVAELYGSVKSSSAKSWEHIKEGFSKAYKALYDSWDKSEKEFGPDK